MKYQNRMGKTKTCMHPDDGNCSKTIITAHSVGKSSGLKSIAKNGHVYMFRNAHGPDKRIQTLHDLIEIKSIGINKATTFTGFCSYHDNKLFKSIDDPECEPSLENAVLLAYRSHARELYAKQDIVNAVNKNNEERNISNKFIKENYELTKKGQTIGIIQLLKESDAFKKSILTNDYKQFDYCWLRFEAKPVLCFSGGFGPEFDYKGNLLEDYAIRTLNRDFIFINSFGSNNFINFVMVWRSDATKSRQFAESFLTIDDKRKSDAIVYTAFEYLENLAFSIDWWNALRITQKSQLIKRYVSSFSTLPRRDPCSVVLDTRSYVNWHLTKTTTSLVI